MFRKRQSNAYITHMPGDWRDPSNHVTPPNENTISIEGIAAEVKQVSHDSRLKVGGERRPEPKRVYRDRS